MYVLFDRDLDGAISYNLVSRYLLKNKQHIAKAINNYYLPVILRMIDSAKVMLLDVSISKDYDLKIIHNGHHDIFLIDHHLNNKLSMIANKKIIEKAPSTANIIYRYLTRNNVKLSNIDAKLVEYADAADMSRCNELDGRDAILCDIWDILTPYVKPNELVLLAKTIHENLYSPPMHLYARVMDACLKSMNLVYDNAVLHERDALVSLVDARKIEYGLVYRSAKNYRLVVIINNRKQYGSAAFKIWGEQPLVSSVYKYIVKKYKNYLHTGGGRRVKVIRIKTVISKEDAEEIVEYIKRLLKSKRTAEKKVAVTTVKQL